MNFDAWPSLLFSVILWNFSILSVAVLNKKHESFVHDMPCYICAAEWKLRNSNRRSAIDNDEKAKLAEDEDKCEATVVQEVENTLKLMQPESWQNVAIDGFTLKRDTDRFLNDHQNSLPMEQFRKRLVTLHSRWEKYWMQQDFNKWTALRFWLRLPGLRRRLQILEKDLKSERQSRRLRRLLQRVQRAQKILETVKKKLQDIYAVFHREGKSQYSETTLNNRFVVILNRKLAQSRRRYSQPKPTYLPRYQTKIRKCNRLNNQLCL